MLRAIIRRRDLLAVRPRIGHADPSAPLVPAGARALLTTVKGIGIYYLFPVVHDGRDTVYVVSLRRGSRMPLTDPEYARRWIEAASQLPSRWRGEHGEPARDPEAG